MPDSLIKDSQTSVKTSAIVYHSGAPAWDLLADEVAYPFLVEEKGTEFLLYVFIRQHSDPVSKGGFFHEYKTALQRAIPSMPVEGDEMEIAVPNEQSFRSFVDDHFVRFEGVGEKDTSKHRLYLDKKPALKTRIFKECLQRIRLKKGVADSEPVSLLDIDIDASESRVELIQDLYIPSKNRVEEVVMTHVSEPESELNFQRWRKATSSKYNTRKRIFTNTENYDVLSKIYDDEQLAVEGMLINGAPCTLENKDKWTKLVPLEHKMLVLEKKYRPYLVKNA